MKKQYITPSAQTVELLAQGMMALSTSMKYDDTTTVTAESKVLSNEKGWDSSNWTATDED